MIVGLAETGGMLGVMIGEMIIAHSVINSGWRYSMFIFSSICAIIALACWLIIRDKPNNHNDIVISDCDDHGEKIGFLESISNIISMPQQWLNGIYCGLMQSILTAFIALWAQPYLVNVYHMSMTKACFISYST